MSTSAVPAVSESMTIPAVPGQVREARAFVARVLGPAHPHVSLALMLCSELVTNSLRHSGSAVPSGVVTVTVVAGEKVVRVKVTDRIGDGVPFLPSAASAGGDAEGGGATSEAADSRRPGSRYRLYCSRCNIPRCPVRA
jgi:anti-sigma regulatory factor (Ser/Thr protein kinase)